MAKPPTEDQIKYLDSLNISSEHMSLGSASSLIAFFQKYSDKNEFNPKKKLAAIYREKFQPLEGKEIRIKNSRPLQRGTVIYLTPGINLQIILGSIRFNYDPTRDEFWKAVVRFPSHRIKRISLHSIEVIDPAKNC